MSESWTDTMWHYVALVNHQNSISIWIVWLVPLYQRFENPRKSNVFLPCSCQSLKENGAHVAMDFLSQLLGVCSSVEKSKLTENVASDMQLSAFEFRNYQTKLESSQQRMVERVVNREID